MPSAAELISTKIEIGMWPDIAPRKAKGFVRSGNWVRWTPQMQPIGGWQTALYSQSLRYHGKARKLIEWSDNNGVGLVAIGSHTSMWVMNDSLLYNITPIEEYAALTAAISTVAGSPTFTVTKATHGYVAGMLVRFPSGPTVDSVQLTSNYYEITTVTTNSFTFTAQANAVAGGGGLGGTLLDMDVFLRPGLEYSLAGPGYGAGAYDVGTYGGNVATNYKARVWTGGAIGETLIACPRGGALYEFAPAFSTTDLAERITNNGLLTSAGFTLVSASYDQPNTEIDFVSSGGSLATSVTVPSGRWLRARFTARNVTGGSVALQIGTVTVAPFGAVSQAVNANGRYTYEFFNTTTTAQTLKWAATNFTGSIAGLTLKVTDTLTKNPNAPASNLGCLTTPQGHAVTYGSTDSATGLVDPMLVCVSDILNTQVWTASASNQARKFYLRDGQQILMGLNGSDGQLFFLTNRSLWEAAYRGQPDIFEFIRRETDCGVIGVRAACWHKKRLYWMSMSKEFLCWDGAQVTAVYCPGRADVFDNITPAQWDLCEAHSHNFDEVWFTYPDQRFSVPEVNRYAFLMLQMDSKWSFGSYGRTAWSTPGGLGFPLAAQDGIIYYQECGKNADGLDALNWSARCTAIQIGFGNTLGEVSGFIPDVARDATGATSQMGPFTVRFYGYQANANSTPEDSGPQTVTSNAEYVMGFFVQGRQIDIEFAGNYAVVLGDPQYMLQDTGNEF